MTQDEAYKAWWHNEGSGIIPLPNEDMEEFAHRMTQIAWSNGAFKEREEVTKERDKKPWVGLTDNERDEICLGDESIARYIEAMLREKNGGKNDKSMSQRKPLTDEMVVAAARMLNERQADACGVDKDDQWKMYGQDFIEDARAMLEAAHGIKE